MKNEGNIVNAQAGSYEYYWRERFRLTNDYSRSEQYYYVLKSNQKIRKVYDGRFTSLTLAEKNGTDITASILPADRSKEPYGYLLPFNRTSESIYFTLLYEDGTLAAYQVYVTGTLIGGETEFDEKPVVRRADPYFRATNIGNYGYYDVFAVENDSDQVLDTWYGYGYQTLFVNDADVDLSSLPLHFWTPSDVRVHDLKGEIQNGAEQDFSDGSVHYTAHIGDNRTGYEVTVVKKEHGPKLYVNYPGKREIFLVEYFENRHDILIANVGDEELTGLKVELIDPIHVKLDDYWTIGGEKNDTLAPFTTVIESQMDNLAKIQLLPDGEGEISGTVKISADGQEDVLIELTGYAVNPRIPTEELVDGVKYVPYSQVIATSNMYDWNREDITIVEGELPEGLELNEGTGEIYGVPRESGEFPITIEVSYDSWMFEPSTAEFTLTIQENTNENVYNASDEGYILEEHIGTEAAAGTYDYVLNSYIDQLFVSSGEMNEFIDLWLNAEQLVEGVDYTKESGSTRITIQSQTFKNKAKNGANTIAAEFRVGGDRNKELKRTAQNFRLDISGSGAGGGSGSGNGSASKPGGTSGGGGGSHSTNQSGPGGQSGQSGAQTQTPVTVPQTQNTQTGAADGSWVQDGTGWWYRNPDGTYPVNSWKQLSYAGRTDWYRFNEQGYVMTGWFRENGQWYYLNPVSDGTKGRMMTGWQVIDGGWYYFDGESGAMVSGGWRFLPYEGVTDWYYFDPQGRMMTGWIMENGKRYYLNPVSDGFQGRMETGWKQIGTRWFYFNEESDGTKGALLVDTWIGDDYVNKNGVWVK